MNIFVLVILFITADGSTGAAFDKNNHATEESCKARAEHLVKSAPAQRFQYIETICKRIPAPKLEIDESTPAIGSNT